MDSMPRLVVPRLVNGVVLDHPFDAGCGFRCGRRLWMKRASLVEGGFSRQQVLLGVVV